MLEDIITSVFLIAESAQDFELAQKEVGVRRKVIRNNIDYLLTAAEERHSRLSNPRYNNGAGDYTDIRMSVKDNYRKFFDEPSVHGGGQAKKVVANLENFEISPTLGVHGDKEEQSDLRMIEIERSISEKEYFK